MYYILNHTVRQYNILPILTSLGIMNSGTLPCRYLVVWSYHWKHQKSLWNQSAKLTIQTHDIILVSLLLTLNRFHILLCCFPNEFEKINVGCTFHLRSSFLNCRMDFGLLNATHNICENICHLQQSENELIVCYSTIIK